VTIGNSDVPCFGANDWILKFNGHALSEGSVAVAFENLNGALSHVRALTRKNHILFPVSI
jgi:hypothetical protein